MPTAIAWSPLDHEVPLADDEAHRTHPRSVLAHMLVTVAGGFWAFTRLQVETVAQDSGRSAPGIGWMLGIVALGMVGHVAYTLLQWRAFTFRVGDHRLVIDHGVLTRHHVVVPYDRVQQVDVNRKLTSMLLGLAEVRIDTAGQEGHTNVRLRYLTPESANGLRAFVLQHRDQRRIDAETNRTRDVGAATTAVPAPAEVTLVTLRPKDLVLAGLTGHELQFGLPLLLVTLSWMGAFVLVGRGTALGGAFFLIGGGVVTAIMVFAAITALVGQIVKQWAFSLTTTGDELHLRFGLTDQRHLTVPRRRVQHVEVIDNPVRRALGLVTVRLHSAAATGGAGHGHAASHFEIPLLRRADLDDVLPAILGDEHWRIPTLTPRPPRARRRAVRRRVVVLALLLTGPSVLLGRVGLLLVPLALAGVPWGRAAHRRAGHALTPSVVALGHGVLHHRITLIPIERIQSARCTASPWQRAGDLATLWLDVAQAPLAPFLYDADATTAATLRADLPRRADALADR